MRADMSSDRETLLYDLLTVGTCLWRPFGALNVFMLYSFPYLVYNIGIEVEDITTSDLKSWKLHTFHIRSPILILTYDPNKECEMKSIEYSHNVAQIFTKNHMEIENWWRNSTDSIIPCSDPHLQIANWERSICRMIWKFRFGWNHISHICVECRVKSWLKMKICS